MGDFTIRVRHLTWINVAVLLVNADHLKSVSAESEYLTAHKALYLDHLLGAVMLNAVITALHWLCSTLSPCSKRGILSTSLNLGGTSSHED